MLKQTVIMISVVMKLQIFGSYHPSWISLSRDGLRLIKCNV
jgi:hypothetical protein